MDILYSIIWVLTYSGLTCWAAWAFSTFQALAQQIKAGKPGEVRLCRAYWAFDRAPDAGCGPSWPGWPVQAGLASSGRAGRSFFAFSLATLACFGQTGLAPWPRLPRFFIPWPARPKPGILPGLPRLSGQALTPVFPGRPGSWCKGISGLDHYHIEVIQDKLYHNRPIANVFKTTVIYAKFGKIYCQTQKPWTPQICWECLLCYVDYRGPFWSKL